MTPELLDAVPKLRLVPEENPPEAEGVLPLDLLVLAGPLDLLVPEVKPLDLPLELGLELKPLELPLLKLPPPRWAKAGPNASAKMTIKPAIMRFMFNISPLCF